MKRVFCPRHMEQTPSCVVYHDGAFCYGGCGAIPLIEVGEMASLPETPKFQENLVETRMYIDELPKKNIRGVVLPYDDSGYFITWDDHPYYKRRNWTDSEAKYKNPSGHKQPMFIVRQLSSGRAFLVEGEINAMSLAEAFPTDSVFSPGSASNFKTYTPQALLTHLSPYSTVVVVTDRDGPGTEAAIHAKGAILSKIPDTKIVLMPEDANDLLYTYGKEALKANFEDLLQKGL